MPPFLNYIFLLTSNICFCQQLFPQQSHQQEQKQSLQIQFHQVLICWGSIELCKLTLIRVNHLSWFLPAGTRSKSTPSPGDGSSSGNSIKLSIPLLLILAAATYASVFWTYWFFNQLATHLKCYFFFACYYRLLLCNHLYYQGPLCWRVQSIHFVTSIGLHHFVLWEALFSPLSIKHGLKFVVSSWSSKAKNIIKSMQLCGTLQHYERQ